MKSRQRATPSEGVGEALTEARRLCERLAHPPELVSVLYGLWTHALMRTELRQAEQVAEEILRLGQARRIGAWTARGCRLAGLTCIARGQYEAAQIDTSSAGFSSTIPAKMAVGLFLHPVRPADNFAYVSWDRVI